MFVAVHAGAGFHSERRAAEYADAMRAAVDAGLAEGARRDADDDAADADEADAADGASANANANASANAGAALRAAVAAVASLEASGAANAGLGSSLAADGAAEADASAMRGSDGAFGAVAATPGVRHPCRAALLLATESALPLPLGLVRPSVLAGDGARRWALSRGLEGEEDAGRAPAYLAASVRAQRAWRRHRRALADEEARAAAGQGAAAALPPSKRPRPAASDDDNDDEDDGGWALDTVGAVAVDARGRVAAAVSSGGLAMKTPGRVGAAAVFGAACWADDGGGGGFGGRFGGGGGGEGGSRPGVAVSVSGVGERVMRAGLARSLGERCAAAAAEAEREGNGGSESNSDRGSEREPPPPAPSLAHTCADVLRRLILAGPLPHDAGVIVARAIPTPASPDAATVARNARQPPPPSSVRVELAAALSSPSFAVAYRGPGMARAEAVVLRRPGSGGAAAVHTFEAGLTLSLPTTRRRGGKD